MSDDIVLDAGRAPLIKVFETTFYRLVQQDWDEDGAWYRLYRRDGMLADAEAYPLDEALSLLLDREAHALTGEVAAMQTPEGDLESGDIPF